jgi:hypothetical protein
MPDAGVGPMLIVIGLWTFLRVMFCGSATIALENLALRHQLAVLQRSDRRPRLSRWDRILWVWLSRRWTGWRSSLVIVQPATVLAWHRRGFQLYWRRLSWRFQLARRRSPSSPIVAQTWRRSRTPSTRSGSRSGIPTTVTPQDRCRVGGGRSTGTAVVRP